MTIAASDLGPDMHHMRKINMVGQLVNPYPGNRFPAFPVFRELFDRRAVGGNVLVTSAAEGQIRNSCDRTGLDMAMTETAVDLIVAGMEFVAERKRLLG